MKLTISAAEIEALMKGVFGRAPTKKAILKITAIDGKLILQSGNGGAATLAAHQHRRSDLARKIVPPSAGHLFPCRPPRNRRQRRWPAHEFPQDAHLILERHANDA